MAKKESVHARRLKEIEAEQRARHAKVDEGVKNREALKRAGDPNAPERLNPTGVLKRTGAGRSVTAIKELYDHATRKKPGEKGYKPANPNKPMGTKKKKKKPSKTYHYEYK